MIESEDEEKPSKIVGAAHPRVGILGNPSDGYGGRVLAATFSNFVTRVTRLDHPEKLIFGNEAFPTSESTIRSAIDARYLTLGEALLASAWLAWISEEEEDHSRNGLQLTFESDIPRQVGLSGSSAIVIAALRALMKSSARSHSREPGNTPAQVRVGSGIDPLRLARLASLAEQKILGIAGGPQDRVVQSFEGLLLMDFEHTMEEKVQSLDPALIPPSFVAWDPVLGESSGIVHQDLRERYARGDQDVLETLKKIADLAERGVTALRAGDFGTFKSLVDENFDRRASIMKLRDRDVEMVRVGRAKGAAVKFCGSGGAVFGVLPDDDPSSVERISLAYRERGWAFGRPAWSVTGRGS